MEKIKCSSCSADIEYSAGQRSVVCPVCGKAQLITSSAPSADNANVRRPTPMQAVPQQGLGRQPSQAQALTGSEQEELYKGSVSRWRLICILAISLVWVLLLAGLILMCRKSPAAIFLLIASLIAFIMIPLSLRGTRPTANIMNDRRRRERTKKYRYIASRMKYNEQFMASLGTSRQGVNNMTEDQIVQRMISQDTLRAGHGEDTDSIINERLRKVPGYMPGIFRTGEPPQAFTTAVYFLIEIAGCAAVVLLVMLIAGKADLIAGLKALF